MDTAQLHRTLLTPFIFVSQQPIFPGTTPLSGLQAQVHCFYLHHLTWTARFMPRSSRRFFPRTAAMIAKGAKMGASLVDHLKTWTQYNCIRRCWRPSYLSVNSCFFRTQPQFQDGKLTFIAFPGEFPESCYFCYIQQLQFLGGCARENLKMFLLDF